MNPMILTGLSFTFKEHLVLAWLKSVNYYIAQSQIKGWLISRFLISDTISLVGRLKA